MVASFLSVDQNFLDFMVFFLEKLQKKLWYLQNLVLFEERSQKLVKLDQKSCSRGFWIRMNKNHYFFDLILLNLWTADQVDTWYEFNSINSYDNNLQALHSLLTGPWIVL